jgi:4-hydroxy-tetrahydrodipicolinate synthase
MADETGMPYLSPALLTRIMNEVSLVVGVKQSAGDLKLFADLMMMAPDKLIYSGVHRAKTQAQTIAPGAYGPLYRRCPAVTVRLRTGLVA